MASTIPLDTLKASTVHSPKMKSVKALAESASLSSLPSIYSFTHNPHDETIISDDAEDSVPIIDVSLLVSGTPEERSQVVHQLNKACSDWGCFMVINHGVPESLTKAMIESFQEFFNLPEEEKQEFHGNHVMDPIRCGTGFNPSMDKVNLWRDYLKCFTYPEFHSPNKPAGFSELSLEYCERTRGLARELLKAISESLGLEPFYIEKVMNLDKGLQILYANFYPPCPQPELAMGLPPHSDHGLLSLVTHNGIGGFQLQHNGMWVNVNAIHNSFLVNIADQLEILSNGKYKSILHRAVVNKKVTRISLVMTNGPPLNKIVNPAPELVNNGIDQPAYHGITYKEYLQCRQSNSLDGKGNLDRIRI